MDALAAAFLAGVLTAVGVTLALLFLAGVLVVGAFLFLAGVLLTAGGAVFVFLLVVDGEGTAL